MANGPKVVIDLNIILDVLQRRDKFYEKSAQILAAAETDTIEGYLAAHSLTTLHYLIARPLGADQARVILNQLLSILKIAPVNQTVIEAALILGYSDFEDAVLMMAAVHIGADYVVSRNTQDFQGGPLPTLSPTELLSIIRKTKGSET